MPHLLTLVQKKVSPLQVMAQHHQQQLSCLSFVLFSSYSLIIPLLLDLSVEVRNDLTLISLCLALHVDAVCSLLGEQNSHSLPISWDFCPGEKRVVAFSYPLSAEHMIIRIKSRKKNTIHLEEMEKREEMRKYIINKTEEYEQAFQEGKAANLGFSENDNPTALVVDLLSIDGDLVLEKLMGIRQDHIGER
ncbi:hypothetical protein DKX38_029799 [Salix brachista]|uniref:Uncharacterized protein n=1 Tax=Salix brachista TaxID=2182728 RepID=A0A5N5J0K7_9ROSI|nr:hypothetical protein DKX38_029799 [Salix brachista]